MPTTAEQYRILAKMIEDLCELKKRYFYLWHYTCSKSVPDDYRKAMEDLMENAKNECGHWALTDPTLHLYWEVWWAFHRVSTPMDTEEIRRVLRKKLEIEIEL
ncbi:hypothetical protein [Pseudomonas sp. MBLB4136]|uniref:hypothetical protein n=1 Tax=Pseudomonas sp. MBLB4136 TaxID=3451558 RepID=UPI003F75292A